jgi:copper-binding protein NosD
MITSRCGRRHSPLRSISSVLVIAACTTFGWVIVTDARTVPGSPTAPACIHPKITFSSNERKVSLQYERGEWQFVRPVLSPWHFRPVGRIYWVSPNGDDAADGSSSHPLHTLGKAVNLADPGDVVYARAGTYAERLTIEKSGEAGKPIVLSCAPGKLGQVKIAPSRAEVAQNRTGAVITLRGAHHVWINGFVIEGPRGRPDAPKQETYGANGITWANGSGPGCRATNNVVYGNVHCGLKEMGHGGAGIVIEGNLVFENGTAPTDHGIYCPADGLTINGNILLNNAGFGIHSYIRPKSQRITRNLCLGNREGGILLAGSANRVYHNVCASNAVGIFYFRGDCSDNVVKNNIFAFNRTDCGYDSGGGQLGDPSRNTDDYNCYHPGKPDPRLHPGAHEIVGDPRFVDATHGDFRLKRDSPCRGRACGGGPHDAVPMRDLGAF